MEGSVFVSKDFFKKMLVTYMCVMIIPLLCGAVVYEYILKINTENVISLITDSFENNVDKVTNDLENAESTMNSIAFNPEFSNFFYDYVPVIEINTNDVIGFSKLLNSYRFNDKFVDEIFIYSKHLDMLIAPDAIYSQPINFFEDRYRAENETAQETQKRLVKGNEQKFTPKTKVENEYVKFPVIEFQKSVPIVGKQSDGMITVLVKSESLFAPFKQIIKESGGNIRVFYNGKRIYYGGASEKEIKRLKTYDFSFSPNSMFKYEISIPLSYIRKNTRIMNIVLILINAVSLIIGTLLCMYMAMKKMRSYEDIIMKMGLWTDSVETKKGNELETIGRFIDDIMKSNEETEKELLEQKRIGDIYDCVHRLLLGAYKTNEEALCAVNENGVVFEGDKYAVMLLSFEKGLRDTEEGVNIKSFVQSVITETMDGMIYTYRTDIHNIAAIVSFEGSKEDFCAYLKNSVSSLRVSLVYKYNIDVRISVGGIAESLDGVSASFREAEAVVDYLNHIGEDKCVLYSELPKNGEKYFYTAELEDEIIKYVHIGEDEKAIQILKKIREINLSERTLSPDAVKKLSARIEMTMIKISEKMGGDLNFAFKKKALPLLFDYAAEYIRAAASAVKKPAARRSDVLHNEIVEYVNKNYADSDLSLEKLSARFSLNVAYTSTVFRKKTGDTFLHYVERLRIKKACELILTSEYKISEIAEKTGYTNDTSFRRCFKHITGLSPSQYYAKNIKKSKD